MPNYEFKCKVCSVEFERTQKVNDALPSCEKCGAETQRLISQTSFRLPGIGWARDGYCSVTPLAKETERKIKAAQNGQKI